MSKKEQEAAVVALPCCDGCGLPPRYSRVNVRDNDAASNNNNNHGQHEPNKDDSVKRVTCVTAAVATKTTTSIVRMVEQPQPLKRCGHCRSVAYHDADCQRRHWPMHKAECRRRCRVVAATAAGTKDIMAAATVVSSIPTAAANKSAASASSSRARRSSEDDDSNDNNHMSSIRLEQRPGRGTCVLAARPLPRWHRITGNDRGSALNSNTATAASFFDPLVPPVLVTSQRKHRCAVCLASVAQDKDDKSKDDDDDPYFHAKYPVALCLVCRCHHHAAASRLPMWLQRERTVVRAVLERYTHPSLVVLPTALLVYRVLLAGGRPGRDVWMSPTMTTTTTGDNKEKNTDSGISNDTSAPPPPSWTLADVLAMATHPPLRTDEQDDAAAAHAHQQAVVWLVVHFMAVEEEDSTGRLDERKVPRLMESLYAVVVELAQRIRYNAFTITADQNGRNGSSGGTTSNMALAVGLFPSPAVRFNHSCAPNTVQSFTVRPGQGPVLELRTSVAVQAGTELCISYLDSELEGGVACRREALRREYRFDCQCARCVSETTSASGG